MNVQTSIESDDTPLRDLSEAGFAERYAGDRFTAALLVNRFSYVISHMTTKLQTNAFSPMIRDMSDFSVALCGPAETGWAMAAVSPHNAILFGPVPDSVRVTMEEYGWERLRSGDVIIVNDPYRVGNHVNDVSFMYPVFHRGRMVGVFNITAHQLDFGGRTEGGFDITNRSLMHDGLVLPPMLLFREGKPEAATFALIGANTRLPHLILPDLTVIAAAFAFGAELLNETIDKYDLDAVLGAIRYVCDISSEALKRALGKVPDGVYESEQVLDGDGLDNSPEYVVHLRINKQGGRIEFDFSGSSVASRSAINCSWADVKGAIVLALRFSLDPQMPYSSGLQRDVDIILPPGSIVHAKPPAATMIAFELTTAIIRAIMDALNPVLGEDALAPDAWSVAIHSPSGVKANGEPWICHAAVPKFPLNPWGGTRAGDGDTNQMYAFNNYAETGIEPAEAEYPVVVLRRESVPDTAGAGYNRGGAAGIADTWWPHAGDHFGFQTHIRKPTPGVRGGQPGRLGAVWLFEPREDGVMFLPLTLKGDFYARGVALSGLVDPITNEVHPEGRFAYRPMARPAAAGAIARLVGNGAGGWGDPFTREPERVLRDVRDEYITIEGAARDYGVVVTGDPARAPEGLKIDQVATERLRSEQQERAR